MSSMGSGSPTSMRMLSLKNLNRPIDTSYSVRRSTHALAVALGRPKDFPARLLVVVVAGQRLGLALRSLPVEADDLLFAGLRIGADVVAFGQLRELPAVLRRVLA